MLANAKAVMSGAERVEAVVDGEPWTQPPFPYQGKCLQWLRQSYAALPESSRNLIEPVLETAGCGSLFA